MFRRARDDTTLTVTPRYRKYLTWTDRFYFGRAGASHLVRSEELRLLQDRAELLQPLQVVLLGSGRQTNQVKGQIRRSPGADSDAGRLAPAASEECPDGSDIELHNTCYCSGMRTESESSEPMAPTWLSSWAQPDVRHDFNRFYRPALNMSFVHLKKKKKKRRFQ